MARPAQHLAMSTVAGGAVWAATGEPLALPVAVAAGVLVDGDHVPDLVWNHVLDRRPVVVVALHGWEWLAALVIVGAIAGFPWWLVAVLVGYGLHLFSDAFFNGHSVAVYSLLYRAVAGFQQSRLTPGSGRADDYGHLRLGFPLALTGITLMRQVLRRPAIAHMDENGHQDPMGNHHPVGGEREGQREWERHE